MATSMAVSSPRLLRLKVLPPPREAHAARRCKHTVLSTATAPPQAWQEKRARLLVDLFPLVKRVATKIRERLPAQVEFDDLVGAGVLGLIDAVDKFDASKQVKLGTYARHRIRGAVLDGLRALDPVSRDLRRKIKRAARVCGDLESQFHRPVTDGELCRAMGMKLEEWYRIAPQIQGVGWEWLRPLGPTGATGKVPSCDELLATRPEYDPFEACYRQEQREILGRLLARLPERQRLVITLYYQQELTMKEIGARMGVDESRVSQLHASALQFLRAEVERTIHGTKPPARFLPQATPPLAV